MTSANNLTSAHSGLTVKWVATNFGLFYFIMLWNCRWDTVTWDHVMQNTQRMYSALIVSVRQGQQQRTNAKNAVNSLTKSIKNSKLPSLLNCATQQSLFSQALLPGGAIEMTLATAFPSAVKKSPSPDLGSLGKVLAPQLLRPYPGPVSQNLSSEPTNHISIMMLGRSVKLFEPEFLHL